MATSTLCLGKRRSRLALLAGLSFAACAQIERDGPRIAEVQPGVVPLGVTSALAIHGVNFYARPEVRLSSQDAVKIHWDFQVFIDRAPLAPGMVKVESSRIIRVQSPANLALGPHAVTVKTPEGLSDTLENAFVVAVPDTDTGAGGSGATGGAPSTQAGGNGTGSAQNVEPAPTLASGGSTNLSSGGSPANTGLGTGGALVGAGGSALGSAGGAGATGGSGTGGSPGLVNGCNELDPVTGKCIHTCAIKPGGAIDYCTRHFFAKTADCVYSVNPNPDTCAAEAGPGEIAVGLDRPSVGSNAHAYYYFELDKALYPGAIVDAVYLVARSTKNAVAGSDATGTVWFSERFQRSDLFSKLPLQIGSAPIAQDSGLIRVDEDVYWPLPRAAFTFPSQVFMTVVPTSADAVHYFGMQEPSAQAYIQVDYH